MLSLSPALSAIFGDVPTVNTRFGIFSLKAWEEHSWRFVSFFPDPIFLMPRDDSDRIKDRTCHVNLRCYLGTTIWRKGEHQEWTFFVLSDCWEMKEKEQEEQGQQGHEQEQIQKQQEGEQVQGHGQGQEQQELEQEQEQEQQEQQQLCPESREVHDEKDESAFGQESPDSDEKNSLEKAHSKSPDGALIANWPEDVTFANDPACSKQLQQQLLSANPGLNFQIPVLLKKGPYRVICQKNIRRSNMILFERTGQLKMCNNESVETILKNPGVKKIREIVQLNRTLILDSQQIANEGVFIRSTTQKKYANVRLVAIHNQLFIVSTRPIRRNEELAVFCSEHDSPLSIPVDDMKTKKLLPAHPSCWPHHMTYRRRNDRRLVPDLIFRMRKISEHFKSFHVELKQKDGQIVGVFAKQEAAEWQPLMFFTGVLELEELCGKISGNVFDDFHFGVFAFTLRTKSSSHRFRVVINSSKTGNETRFLNDCSSGHDPNVGIVFLNSFAVLVSLRAIEKGEELLIDRCC